MNLDVHKRITASGGRVVIVTDDHGNRVEVSWQGKVSDELMGRAMDEARHVRLLDVTEGVTRE